MEKIEPTHLEIHQVIKNLILGTQTDLSKKNLTSWDTLSLHLFYSYDQTKS